MATYIELDTFLSSPDRAALATRVLSATTLKAASIAKAAGASASSKAWAKSALDNPAEYNQAVFRYVVFDSAAMTTAQIAALTDSEVQVKVDRAVDALYNA